MRGHLARLWPKTMAARITLIMVIALFVAQILNVALLMGERQLEALSTRTTLAERACTPTAMDIARMAEPPRQADLRRLATPAMTFFLTRDGLPPGAKLTPDPQLAERIAGAFTREKTAFLAIEAGTRHQRPNTRAPQGMRPMDETFVAFKFAPAESWYVCHVISDAPEKFVTLRLIAGTLVLFVIVLGVTLVATRRVVRPLTILASAVTRLGKVGERAEPIVTKGPTEIVSVADAVNEMNERISVLLQEKDAMLGAIGHDLRTPLTALRIRAENLPHSDDATRMIVLIDHLTHMLNAIVRLARVGHDTEPPVPTDVAGLLTTIVEEFEDLGADVTVRPAAGIIHPLRPHLFMQLVRNLTENGVKYGQRVRISATQENGTLVVAIEDDGPGIAASDVERVLKPFERLDTSRNRETGGTGLGLAIARIIAGMHDAELQFGRADTGSFCVSVIVPPAKPITT